MWVCRLKKKKKKCWSSSPLCHSEESLWSEGSLCVDVHGFTFSTSLINGQLWTQDTVESTECDNYTYDLFNSTDILYSQRRSWNQTIWTIINHQLAIHLLSIDEVSVVCVPDRWQPVCGTAGSSPSETLQTSLWWSPSRSHLQDRQEVMTALSLFCVMTLFSHYLTGANTVRNRNLASVGSVCFTCCFFPTNEMKHTFTGHTSAIYCNQVIVVYWGAFY